MASPSTVPDETRCATRHVYGQVFKCLARDGRRCPHGFAFACSIYCGHANARSFCVQAGGYLPVGAYMLYRMMDPEQTLESP
jgi:hypothetical protein